MLLLETQKTLKSRKALREGRPQLSIYTQNNLVNVGVGGAGVPASSLALMEVVDLQNNCTS